MAVLTAERLIPLRRPKGFEPVVQRWSAAFVNSCDDVCVAFHGIQGKDPRTLYSSAFFKVDDRGDQATIGTDSYGSLMVH